MVMPPSNLEKLRSFIASTSGAGVVTMSRSSLINIEREMAQLHAERAAARAGDTIAGVCERLVQS